MARIPDDQFAAVWAAAGTAAEAARRIGEMFGIVVPRWAVVARATACRAAGTPLPPKPDEAARPREPEVLAKTRALAEQLMAAHGLAGWKFGFNRNVRRAGVCRYPHAGRPGRVELSRHFVERNPEAEVLDTILHEIAHALVGPKHGHDAVWKAKCRQIGARPERCYGEAVDMPKGRWRAACGGCRREFHRHRRPKRLAGWHCKACGPDRGALTWQAAAP